MNNNARLENIKFKALKQHVRAGIDEEIRFNLKNTPIYSEQVALAEFIAPAVSNLSLLGGGLGALKGLMEPRNDAVGQPISINERLGNVALNTIGGGLAGAGAGMGYSALKPGVAKTANAVGDAVKSVPRAIDGQPNILDRIQDIAQGDLQPRQPNRIKKTFETVQRRAKRDTARTKRFFTGKGAGIETTEVPLGRTITTRDPNTNQRVQEFIPDVDRTGAPVTRKIENVNPNAQLDEIPTAERLAASVAGGTAGAVAGVPGAVAGGVAGTGLGAVIGGGLGTLAAPGAGTVAGAAIGAKAGGALGTMAGGIAPALVGGYKGAAEGLSGVKDLYQKTGLQEGVARARNFIGFEYESNHYPLRKISTFAAPTSYKTGALIGAGLGGGAGAIGDVAQTINRQQDREEDELNSIIDIDNPYVRLGEYEQYTSPEQRFVRGARNAVDIAGRGALGLGVGAGVGMGLGGLAGHLADKNIPAKKGLLERVYGR